MGINIYQPLVNIAFVKFAQISQSVKCLLIFSFQTHARFGLAHMLLVCVHYMIKDAPLVMQ